MNSADADIVCAALQLKVVTFMAMRSDLPHSYWISMGWPISNRASRVCIPGDQCQQLSRQAPPSAPALSHALVLLLSNPAWFSRDSDNCLSFLVQCGLHFLTDSVKVAFIISLAELRHGPQLSLPEILCYAILDNLKRVADYATKFHTLAVVSGWNSFSLCDFFYPWSGRST